MTVPQGKPYSGHHRANAQTFFAKFCLFDTFENPYGFPSPDGGRLQLLVKAENMKKILIIEDHASVRDLFRLALEDGPFQFHEAGTGDAGWEMACEILPDIVLLDVLLPGQLGGLDVCRLIKADPRTRGARVIIVSGARVRAADRADGVAAGADHYLVKPFSTARLIEAVHAAHTAMY